MANSENDYRIDYIEFAVEVLERSKAFFEGLGFGFYGMTQDMASVIINDDTQVMLLTEPAFDSFASKQVADPGQSTQVILALGVENRGLRQFPAFGEGEQAVVGNAAPEEE